MGKLKLYDTSIPRETIVGERESAYLSRNPQQRFSSILLLNRISVAMNGGKPLKSPQGKGLVIRKPSIQFSYMSFDKENPEMLSLLENFQQFNLYYLIVGGFAVNRYGYNRTIGDLDI